MFAIQNTWKKLALQGAHIATIPPAFYKALWSHLLTDKGIEQFMEDWQSFQNK